MANDVAGVLAREMPLACSFSLLPPWLELGKEAAVNLSSVRSKLLIICYHQVELGGSVPYCWLRCHEFHSSPDNCFPDPAQIHFHCLIFYCSCYQNVSCQRLEDEN